jgi:hypothetical protein
LHAKRYEYAIFIHISIQIKFQFRSIYPKSKNIFSICLLSWILFLLVFKTITYTCKNELIICSFSLLFYSTYPLLFSCTKTWLHTFTRKMCRANHMMLSASKKGVCVLLSSPHLSKTNYFSHLSYNSSDGRNLFSPRVDRNNLFWFFIQFQSEIKSRLNKKLSVVPSQRHIKKPKRWNI